MTKRKTIRVRIAVAMDHDGSWVATGWPTDEDTLVSCAIETLSDRARVSWIEADVPLPEDRVVEGRVVDG